jgi:hypothetical protein
MNDDELTLRQHPTTFGVFKPVGSVLVSLPDQGLADAAAAALLDDGFSEAQVVRYTAQQMVQQAESDLRQATPLASLGQDLNLVKAQLALARQGQAFVCVKADDDAALQRIVAVARRFHGSRAQRYGNLVIEELLPVGNDEPQVAESPDRGLDEQKRTP